MNKKIKLKIIGDKNFSKKIKKLLNYSEKKQKNKKLQINLAINYGSKSEIVESIKRIKNKKN